MARNDRPTLARDMFESLKAAHSVVEQFEKEFGRAPTDPELRLAASFFIETQKSGGARSLVKADTTAGRPLREVA